MKKLLLILALGTISNLIFAQTAITVDGINYKTTGTNAVKVVKIGNNGGYYKGDITIPSSVSYSGVDYPVTAIGDSAFCFCKNLKSVTIPTSITSIGIRAFISCSILTSVSMPSSITTIGDYAFRNCPLLTSVTIPSQLTYLGNYVFASCAGLTSITIPNTITTIGESTFQSCKGLTSISIPNSVTTIGKYAFSSCIGLTSISIPNSVTKLDEGIFYNCSALASITIPNSVTTIGYSAFYGCTGLTSITIPASVTSIGNSAINKTTIINVDANNLNYSCQSGVLYDKTYSTLIQCPTTVSGSFNIPSSVTSISYMAFSDCQYLTNIYMPASVTTIDRAFDGCLALINIDSNNTNFSSLNGVLYNKNYTTLIRCPISVSGDFAVPSSVSTIQNSAFYTCSNITNITIPNSVTSIGSEAFAGCTKITTVTIPNSIKSINWDTFASCSSLLTISIPSSVDSIAHDAFTNCTSLKKVTLPSSVIYIGPYAFFYCTGLSEIQISSVIPPSLGGSVFSQVDQTKCILYVPSGSLGAYQAADQWKNFTNIVEVATEVNTVKSAIVKIYPNQAVSILNIDFNHISNYRNLSIYNSLGQKMYETNINGNEMQIDVSRYQKGIYYIQTIDKNNRFSNLGRFILQ